MVLAFEQNVLNHRFINVFIQASIFDAALFEMLAQNGCHSRGEIIKLNYNGLLIFFPFQTLFLHGRMDNYCSNRDEKFSVIYCLKM